MLFVPKPLGKGSIASDIIKTDIEKAEKFGKCAVSSKAIYIGNIIRSNSRYVPVSSVDRVFKRLAVTKGFFEGNRVFATIPYLVVVYDGGLEKQVKFDNEEELNLLLDSVKRKTNIPVGKVKKNDNN